MTNNNNNNKQLKTNSLPSKKTKLKVLNDKEFKKIIEGKNYQKDPLKNIPKETWILYYALLSVIGLSGLLLGYILDHYWW